MEDIKNDFKKIDTHAALNDFVSNYSLRKLESNNTSILATYTGVIDGNQVFVKHRWYDRCKTYVIQEDGNEISIEIKTPSGETIFNNSVKYVQD